MSDICFDDLHASAAAVESRLGISRREFLQFCAAAAGTLGLGGGAEAAIAKAVERQRPSVIWLHFQECTGCTESLLRAEHPTLEKLILDMISLDYHETLMAAAGHQAEAARKAAMKRTRASTCWWSRAPSRPKTAASTARSAADTAWSWSRKGGRRGGGDRHRLLRLLGRHAVDGPQPDRCGGVAEVLGKTVLTIPGCPPNPYNFLVTVVYFLTFGKLPAIDKWPPEVRLRPPDPRELRAPRAFRRRPLRPGVRRRGPPQGLLPVQARLQGTGDLRQLLGDRLRRRRRSTGRSAAAIPASAAPRRASASPSRSMRWPSCAHDAAGRVSPSTSSRAAKLRCRRGAGGVVGAAVGAAAMLAKNLGKSSAGQPPPRRRNREGNDHQPPGFLHGRRRRGAAVRPHAPPKRGRTGRYRPTPSACSTTPPFASAARRAWRRARPPTKCRPTTPPPSALGHAARTVRQDLNVIKVYRTATAVKDHENDGFAFIKRPCLHCVDPSCVSVCPV